MHIDYYLNLLMKKALLYQILVFTIFRKTQKIHTTTVNLKYQFQHYSME